MVVYDCDQYIALIATRNISISKALSYFCGLVGQTGQKGRLENGLSNTAPHPVLENPRFRVRIFTL